MLGYELFCAYARWSTTTGQNIYQHFLLRINSEKDECMMASTDSTIELSIYKYVCCDIKPTKPPPHRALVPVHPGIQAALSPRNEPKRQRGLEARGT